VIVVVLGMHKSGTTLVARTLHEAGINMGVSKTGGYPQCKYEDRRALSIKSAILYDGRPRHSLVLPTSDHDCREDIRIYATCRSKESENWGVKVPGITLCYDQWADALPTHKVIGVRRSLEGVQEHYAKTPRKPDPDLVQAVWSRYNLTLDNIGCPVVRFENLIEYGPGAISDALGLEKLPDVRE